MHLRICAAFLLLMLAGHCRGGCLMKLSHKGGTLVVCNEDSPIPNAAICFKPKGKKTIGYILLKNEIPVYTNGDPYPDHTQAGFNETGLMVHISPSQPHQALKNGRKPRPPRGFVEQLLSTCSTLNQCRQLLERHDLHGFSFIFVSDKKGNQLTYELGRLSTGKNVTYIQPALSTKDTDQRWQYDTIQTLVRSGVQPSLDFCLKVAQATQVDSPMGGTQYTYLSDSETGLLHVYFYRDFNHALDLDIKKELKKGERIIRLADLFSENPKATEHARVFNHHIGIIKQLADSAILKNPVRLKALKDSIAGIAQDHRFDGQRLFNQELWSYCLCLMGDYWLERNNLNTATHLYLFTKRIYPHSWGSYDRLGYLCKSRKLNHLALENFVIANGLNPKPSYLTEMNALNKSLAHSTTGSKDNRCGFFRGSDNSFVSINRIDGQYKVYFGEGGSILETFTGKALSDKFLLAGTSSLVFSESGKDGFNKLKVYRPGKQNVVDLSRTEIPSSPQRQ